MSNILNTLSYSKFLERRKEFTMNYSEVGGTFDRDIYSILKSRQRFKVVEDMILDIGEETTPDKPLEVRDIIIKDKKTLMMEQQDKKAEKKVEKKDEKKVEKKDEKKVDKKVVIDDKKVVIDDKKVVIDDSEKEFLFASKPQIEPEELKDSHQATFKNETKEILQEDKNKKRIIITPDALEESKAKSPRKKKS
jgi:hypothetical protein